MPNYRKLFTATDKEIYDIIMGGKRHYTQNVLQDFAKDRGIFYSPRDTREDLANKIAQLPFDYHALDTLIGHRDYTQRTEKVASIQLNATLQQHDLKTVLNTYKETATGDDRVTIHQPDQNRTIIKVRYTEIDHTKTRLLQRREREADIEIDRQGDNAIVRFPANAKAQDIVRTVTGALEAQTKAPIPTNEITVAALSPQQRTKFFTILISTLSGYTLYDVRSVHVATKNTAIDDLEDDEEEETTQAQEAMLAVVKNVALHGQSLLSSPEYRQLDANGFFITNITWRSKFRSSPSDIIECEAGFTVPTQGHGFTYNIRGIIKDNMGTYTKTVRPLSKEVRGVYLTLIEQTARAALAAVNTTTAP